MGGTNLLDEVENGGNFPLRQTELQSRRSPGDEVAAIEELRCAGYRRSLLRRHLSGTANEAAHPCRETARHLAAHLRHSALPPLCSRRRNSTPALRKRLPAATRITPECPTGTGPRLASLRNSGESPVEITLDWSAGLRYPHLKYPIASQSTAVPLIRLTLSLPRLSVVSFFSPPSELRSVACVPPRAEVRVRLFLVSEEEQREER